MRTPALRTVAATVGAAVVLVAGFDAATLAATGDSLMLGKINRAGTTTTVSNTGRGPALNLVTGNLYAPLKVNSRKKVANLNADTVDGMDAKVLEPAPIRLRIGTNWTNMPDNSLRQVTLPTGWYEVTMTGVLNNTESDGTTSENITCLAADKRLVEALSSPQPNVNDLYTAEFHSFDEGQLIMGVSALSRVRGGAPVVYGCFAYTSGSATNFVQQAKAVEFSFRKVPAPVTKSGSSYTPPSPRAAHRQLQRLAGR